MAWGDTIGEVRNLAQERGVSERTVWRWFAAIRASGQTDLDSLAWPRPCAYCQTPLPENATIRRVYCDDICRQYARRRRLAFGTSWPQHASTWVV
jgi:hypothetical protein